MPPTYLRPELHHHQHQHTHLHQHQPIIPTPAATPSAPLFPPPLFKDIPKMGAIDSSFYRTGLGLPSYPGYSPSLMHPGIGGPTPFVPPTHLPSFAPKVSAIGYTTILNQFHSSEQFIYLKHLQVSLIIHIHIHKHHITFICCFMIKKKRKSK